MAWIFNPETLGSGFLVVSRRYSDVMVISFMKKMTVFHRESQAGSHHHKGGTCNLSLPILKNGWSNCDLTDLFRTIK